jgi:MFS superfamily sulfate permease-like transporter
LGSYQIFLLALVLAGAFQLLLGFIKAGTIGNYFPSSVIEGMLAGIGLLLIRKQLSHAVGYDKDYFLDESTTRTGGENALSAVENAFNSLGQYIGNHIDQFAIDPDLDLLAKNQKA